MKKEKFEKLARETGANNCIDFNWSYNLKESCMRDYDNDILQPCLLLKGCKCNFYGGENEI